MNWYLFIFHFFCTCNSVWIFFFCFFSDIFLCFTDFSCFWGLFLSVLCPSYAALWLVSLKWQLVCYYYWSLWFSCHLSLLLHKQPFPEISFKVFSMFVEDTFGAKISLATVLLVARDNDRIYPDAGILFSSLLECFWQAYKLSSSGFLVIENNMMHQLQDDTEILFQPGEFVPRQNHQVSVLSTKLDKLATLLNLTYTIWF